MRATTPPTLADDVIAAPRPSRAATIRRLLFLLIAVVAVLILPWIIYPPVAMDIAAWALFAISVDLLLGYGGLLSFGHAAFWGSSAYATGYIAINWGVPFPVAILLGALLAMILAVPIGLLSVRSSGIYFAMVTLAFAQMIYFITNQWSSVTGGENGLQGVPKSFFGIGAVQTESFYFYYAAIAIIIIGALIAWRIVHSPFGRVLVGIRDNPARVRALGYDVERYKLIAFVLSAGLAGLAGGVFAISHGFVSLQEVDWTTSGKVVLMTVLGGMGTLWGAAIGAAVIVLLEDYLASAGFEGIGLITGAIFILCVLLFRKGIWGTAESAIERLRSRRSTGHHVASHQRARDTPPRKDSPNDASTAHPDGEKD
ncbi:MAG: branched-chain amino acid ABC transporter permease [Rhodoglobus sp.]